MFIRSRALEVALVAFAKNTETGLISMAWNPVREQGSCGIGLSLGPDCTESTGSMGTVSEPVDRVSMPASCGHLTSMISKAASEAKGSRTGSSFTPPATRTLSGTSAWVFYLSISELPWSWCSTRFVFSLT